MTAYGTERLTPFCSFQKHPFEYKKQKHTEHPALCHTYVLIFLKNLKWRDLQVREFIIES